MKFKFDIFDGSRIDQLQDTDQYKAYFQGLMEGFNFIMVKPNKELKNELNRINKDLYAGQEVGAQFGELREKFLARLEDDKLRSYMNDVFVEGEWALEDAELNNSNYTLGQLMPIASLYSSQIVYHAGKAWSSLRFMDVRDIIKTNDEYLESRILTEITRDNLSKLMHSNPNTTFITQYGIGCTLENNSTVLRPDQKISDLF